MSKDELVPAYYDGQDRSGPPACLKSRSEIKLQRKSGLLDGWYVSNGAAFIIFKSFAVQAARDYREIVAAGNMTDAWKQIQSGYAGPLVLQMPRQRAVHA